MHHATEHLAAEWQAFIDRYPPATMRELQTLATEHANALASHFYEQMLAHEHSATFLSHDQVKTSLHRSMANWIVTLFSTHGLDELRALVETQQRIGHVHARIDIPVSLVLRGARMLKRQLLLLIGQWPLHEASAADARELASGLIDLAMELMCAAFSQSHARNSRAEEAYRLFSVSHNIGAEKERQRAALLDWENQLMFELATGNASRELATLASSEFGLWFRHKASHAFQGSPESASILDYIAQIDEQLPALIEQASASVQNVNLLRQIREQTKSIRYLLDSLFDQAGDLEAGRDVLTRLLNRKFLPVVLGKEVLFSRQTGKSFAVLMLDADHFKSINDTQGHDAGDAVLQQLAGVLSSNTRGGDYAFRLGGEEFLVILVDVDAGRALKMAEKLRQLVAAEPMRLPRGGELHITLSIGVAVHDGHPDYERLLKRADRALYEAKHGGRNRCVLAE